MMRRMTTADDTSRINPIAHDLIHGERQSEYGTFEYNAERIRDRWQDTIRTVTGCYDLKLPVEIVPHMMIDLKMVRLAEKLDAPDSWVDVAGYAGCAGKLPSVQAGVDAKWPPDTAERDEQTLGQSCDEDVKAACAYCGSHFCATNTGGRLCCEACGTLSCQGDCFEAPEPQVVNVQVQAPRFPKLPDFEAIVSEARTRLGKALRSSPRPETRLGHHHVTERVSSEPPAPVEVEPGRFVHPDALKIDADEINPAYRLQHAEPARYTIPRPNVSGS